MAKKHTGLFITLGIIIAVILILVISIVGTYNGLVSSQANVEEKQSAISTQLQRRSDLIPNLVNTVKGYASHEEDVYTAIADARSKLAGAGTVGEMDAANTELSGALSRLLVVVEQYPDLKANQNFIALQDELAGTENRITVARNDYNAAAKQYNVKIKRFPTNIFAGMFGFDAAEFFKADAGATSVPEVSFE